MAGLRRQGKKPCMWRYRFGISLFYVVWRHERLYEGAIVSTVLCVSLVHVAIEYIVRVVDDLCEQPCHLAYTHAYLSLVWRVGKQSTKT